jgi:hypothetical protein
MFHDFTKLKHLYNRKSSELTKHERASLNQFKDFKIFVEYKYHYHDEKYIDQPNINERGEEGLYRKRRRIFLNTNIIIIMRKKCRSTYHINEGEGCYLEKE